MSVSRSNVRRPVTTAAAAVLALVGAALSPPATAAPQPVTARSAAARAQPAVGWQGWRGVRLGSSLTAAQRRLGGTLAHVATGGGGCGDVLRTRGARLDGNGYARPHDVGTISVGRGVSYPLGLRSGQTAARARQLVHAKRATLHQITTDPYGTRDYVYENWVVGPQGHTLYFLSSDGTIRRMGLAVNARVARRQMKMNGC